MQAIAAGLGSTSTTRAANAPARTAPRGASSLVVLAVGAISGVVAIPAGSAPTGHSLTDVMFSAAAVGLVTVVGSRAPWWAVALTGAAAAAISSELIFVAAIVVLLPLMSRMWRVRWAPLAAVATAIAFNLLIRAGHENFLGFTAIVGTLCWAVVFVSGLGNFSRPLRRAAWLAVGVGALVVVAGAAAMAHAVWTVRHSLTDGLRSAELGVAALEHNDFDDAARQFRQAADHLSHAADRLDQPWTAPAAVVPVLAQHRAAVVDMSDVGAEGASTMAAVLEDIDLEGLRVGGGRIDLDALAALEQPLVEVRDTLGELQAATNAAHSPWLVPRASEVLADFDESMAEHVPSLDNALAAVRIGPELLGADRPQRYLLLFTTPAESRGLGGFIGSYAELTVDGGKLTLNDAGQAANLDAAANQAGASVDGPAEFLRRYGHFGYEREDGRVGNAAFRNLAMTPHFPWVGEIAASLYEQTTGRPVDGVIAADPFVIAEFLNYTGPIELSAYEHQQLTADNAVSYLLHDQYVVGADDNSVRRDSLAEAAAKTFAAMMSGGLPDPIRLANDLGPHVEERRLLFWSADEEAQALLRQLAIDGAIPSLDGGDGWAFTVSNGVGSKIDSYLERRASYVSTDERGITKGTLRIELTNTAPADGLPKYIIGGGRLGLPQGTSRLLVSVYSALGLDSMTVDGERVAVDAGTEQGWNVYSRFIEIPAGATVTLEAQLARTIEHPDRIVTWIQPMARPLVLDD